MTKSLSEREVTDYRERGYHFPVEVLTKREVADFARSIPRARFELIKACGHLPSIEQPDRFTAILSAFMSLVSTETVSHVSH